MVIRLVKLGMNSIIQILKDFGVSYIAQMKIGLQVKQKLLLQRLLLSLEIIKKILLKQ
jgi:hypothetical protein